ncbi:MAG TPA: phosphoribosyltransferase family protein [Pyrinomonadaceae bacterium]
MRFKDASEAGVALAAKLGGTGVARGGGTAVVIAVARGGVGVGLEVARRLNLRFDVLLLRRLLAARGPLRPGCVASVAGSRHVDEEVAAALARESEEPALHAFLASALAEFDSQASACRGGRPALRLAGRTVVLVDNGVRTGSTMLAALRALRSTSPSRVVAAAPVADAPALAEVSAAADEFVCLATPAPFGHVGLWYADFRRPSDDDIRSALDEMTKPEA